MVETPHRFQTHCEGNSVDRIVDRLTDGEVGQGSLKSVFVCVWGGGAVVGFYAAQS